MSEFHPDFSRVVFAFPGVFLVGCDSEGMTLRVTEDLITPCYFYSQSEARLIAIVWERFDPQRVVYSYRINQSLWQNQDPSYRNRTQMFENEIAEGNVSLKLRNVSLLDAGTYRVNVSASSGQGFKDIRVMVGAIGHSPRFHSFVTKRNHSVLICDSAGWFPAPSVTWQNWWGLNITKYSQTHETDSRDGRVRVRSAIEFPTGSNGSYTCTIWNPLLYQGTSANYTLPTLGNSPDIHSRVTGGGRSVLTCLSSGWYPAPNLTWHNEQGQAMTKLIQTELTDDIRGSISVKSTLRLEDDSNGNYTCVIWNPMLKQGLRSSFTVLISRYKEIRSHWIAVGAIISTSIFVVAAVIKAKSVIMLVKKERKGHAAFSPAE
ncbi:CD276 antigen homolog [Rhinoraja longicauda]